MSDFVIQAYRLAEDKAQLASCLMGNNPYQANLITITNDQINFDDPVNTRIRNNRRITVADGYLSFAPYDGYLNPYVKSAKADTLVLSANTLTDMEAILGPLVFPYIIGTISGGIDSNVFYPLDGTNNNTQIYIQLIGPGLNTTNGNYFKISEIILSGMDSTYYHLRLTSISDVVV